MAAVNVPQPLPPKDGQTGLSGLYYDQGDGGNQGGVVPGAQTRIWFTSNELSGALLERLNSLQLITSSHDNGSQSADASRSWFELSIFRDPNQAPENQVQNDEAQEEQPLNELRWMSHENRFRTSADEHHKGRVFTRNSDILKHLKRGDRIRVHAAADHAQSENHYTEGVLIFGIGSENDVQPAADPVLRGLLQVHPRDADGDTTFTFLKDKTTNQVEEEIESNGKKPIVSRLRWESTDIIERLANASQRAQKNVLVVFDTDDLLRSTTTDRRLSWGQTVENIWRVMEETCRKIGEQPPNNYFHLLIQIGFEGAIYKGFQTQGTKAHLIYEPTSAEGKLIRSYSDNDMSNFGFNGDKWEKLKKELMVAWERGLVSSLEEESARSIADLGITQIRDAMMTGIRWSRRCAPIMFPKGDTQKSMPTNDRMKLESGSEPVLVSVELDLIVQGQNAQEPTFKRPLVLDSLPCSPKKAAHDILKNGFDSVLPYMPGARFHNLVTADRGEVDGFRKIANTVHEWDLGDKSQPLFIAVFGQPGSGKSFGVKEVITDILTADRGQIAEYNLSQFRQEKDLRDAFGAIQAFQRLPVVFFDEFDSTFQGRELGWLPHFVDPLKGGVYHDGENWQRLKSGIYIFIGGTKTKYEDFFEELSDGRVLGSSPELPDYWTSERNFMALLDAIVRKPDGSYGPTPTAKTLDISQISGYDKLIEVFRELKDWPRAQPGTFPVVFFRNFDSYFGSERLGWLKYFLAPMQDGEYYDDNEPQKIGRAIFVFEQGTHVFNAFPEADLDSEHFPGAKLPDFVSRLRGYVKHEYNHTSLYNILTWYLEKSGVNKPLSIGIFRNCPDPHLEAKKIFKEKLKGHVDILGPSSLGEEDETYFVLRRAMLLRSMLQRSFKFDEGQFIDMDHGVLKALLFTPRVLHGARSLESLLSMSELDKRKKIKMSDICTEDQRILHVKDEAFKRLLNSTGVDSGTQATEENKRRYAWIERKSGRGYKPDPEVQPQR